MMRLKLIHLISVTLAYLMSVNLVLAQSQESNNQIYKGGPTVTAAAAPQNICQGEQSTLSASGSLGTVPYTFAWSNGVNGNTQNVTPAISTTYTVTITDDNGLSATDQITVTVFELPVSGLYLSPTEICEGESALIDANPSGGATPYNYSWNNGLPGNQTNTVSPSGNTNFSVTITDANGCTVEDNISLTVFENPTVTATANPNPVCSGETVDLEANAINGSSPYNYNWNGGLGNSQSHLINPTVDYTYSVSVTDINGCTAEDQVDVQVFDLPSVSADAFPSALCALETGTLSASGVGGSSPYSYIWDNGLGAGNSHIISPADTTTYTVIVTDANGCTGTDDVTVNVWELPIPTATASPLTICENTSTNLNVTSTDGTPPYAYDWSNGLGVGDSHTVFPLSDQTYTVSVADDNGCTAEDAITVTVNSLPNITADASPNPICSGETVNLTAIGGGTIAPYSYFWDNGLGAGQNQTDNPSSSTTYSVTITDGNGCTASDAVLLNTTDNPIPNPVASPNPICPGGSSNLSVTSSGGTVPYTYFWDNGLGAGDSHSVSPASSTTYTVTVTDDTGCTGEASVLLDLRALPNITLDADPNPVCSGENTDITTTLTGGSSPFMFSWDNGLGNAQNPSASPLVTTTYTLTVTDNNGCTTEEAITVTVNDTPTVTANATPNTICPGQTSNLSAVGAGGSPGYSYQWDNGIGPGANHTVSPASTTTYSVTITDSNGCTSEDQITLTVHDEPVISLDAFPNPICALEISNVSASASGGTPGYLFFWDNGLGNGANHVITPASSTTYSATVTDANGCEDYASIFVQVTELPVVTADAIPNPICEGENVTLNAIGNQGQSPYSYSWDQGLGVGSNHTISPTMTTDYSVTISDDYGCTSQDMVTVTVWDLPTITADATPNPICVGDNTDLAAIAGGTIPPYTYIWDNGLGLGTNFTVTPPSDNTYTVTVQDGNGCTASQAVNVIVTDMPPASPTAAPNPVCSGENVTLSITGTDGTAPYSYVWDNGLGAGQTHIVNPTIPTTYSVTVTDATGCTTEGSILVDIYENPTANLIADPNPICETGSTTLYPNPADGTTPYSFVWDNGLPPIENPVASPVTATTYFVTVTDANGCTVEDFVDVTIEPAPTITVNAIPNPVCSGETVDLSALGFGTTAPYSYDWNQGLGTGQNQTDNPSSSTTYTVTVTDGNGCSAEESIIVNTLDLPNVTADASPNPICEGETVNLSAIAIDGSAPYTYQWNQGLGAGQNQTDNPLITTNYEVTVTDNNACTNSDNITVDVNENPVSNLYSNPNPICEDNNAVLFPDITNGTAPFSYTWDNGLPAIENPIVTPVSSTTYNLTVTDNNGCSITDQVTVDVEPAPNIITDAIPNPICPNTASTISATANGSTAPYTYFWGAGLGNGQNHTVTPSDTTTYYLTVTDGNGCTAEDSVTVNTFEEPTVVATANPNPICSGENATVSATGNNGTAPYTYIWNQGLGAGQSHPVNPLIATTYTVTIADDNGCQAQDDITINVSDLPTTNLTANPNPLCEGETSSMNLTVSNGTPPYNFVWNQGLGNMQNPNVTPTVNTNYIVTVTDASGCTVEDNVMVLVNEQPDVNASASPNVICGGQNSVLSAVGSNGTPPYTYAWDNGLGAGNSHTVNPVNTTTYTVSITDANGCENTDQVTVTVTDSPNLLLTANPNPICSLESVFLSAFATDGTAPYIFDWDNGLGAGATHWDNPVGNTTYVVTVTDNTGCQDIDSIEVVVNELPVVTADATPNPVCNGEPVNLNASSANGLAPYSYSWDNGLGVGDSHTVTPISDETYTVTVTDANGCTAEDFIDVIVGDIPTVTTNALPNPVCIGETTNISATGSGTIAPYTYFWGDGIGPGQNQSVTPASDTIFYVSVTDANGCMGTGSLAVNVHELPEANPIATPNPLCLGESTDLSVSGSNGTAPYSYNWDHGLGAGSTHTVSPIVDETYEVTITDDNSCSNTATVDVTINPIPTIVVTGAPNPVCGGEDAIINATANGTTPPYEYNWDNGLGLGQSHTVNPLITTIYTVIATDANGCTVEGSVTLDAYPAPSVTASANPNPICEGFTSDLEAIGAAGTAPYSFNWDNGLGNGSTHIVSPATSTYYHVTITDFNGCTANDSVELIINENPNLNLTASPQVICDGESSTLTANTTDGTPPYNYAWTPALGPNDSYPVSPAASTSYTVTVTDANGCTNEDQVIVTVNENPTVALDAAPNPICYNENTNLSTNVVGGTPAYTYLWSHSLSDQASHTVTLTATDTYFVTVEDINGCQGTDDVTINVNPEILITVNNITEPDCNGNTNASFELSVSGGSPNYTIDWTNGTDNGNFPASAGGPHTINAIPAGNYQIDVTDAAGCTETYNFTINQPNVLSINLDAINDILCFGETNGSVDYTIGGGTADFELQWDNGLNNDLISGLSSGSHTLSNLEAGNYNLTITDANGCEVFDNFTLIEPTDLSFSVNSTDNVSCYNGADGIITVDIGGGTPDYDLAWDNGTTSGTQNGLSAGTQNITGLPAGNYSITLTDNNACTSIENAVIIEPATELQVSILSITDASCVGVNDGTAEIQVSGGVPAYNYAWDHPNGSGTQITNVTAGDYTVSVTDDWGCEVEFIVTIGQPANGLSASPDVTPVSCLLNSDGSITLNTAGGTAPYTYTWDPNVSSGETAINLAAGDYDVTINDDGTCELILTINVPEDPNTLSAEITDTTHISCNGGNDGEITVTASNGYPPYTFSWTGYPLETGNTLSNLSIGNYEVIVTDNLGCEIILSQTLNEPTPLVITGDSITDILCYGDNTGEIFTTASGGTIPYSYTWENASGTDLGVNADNISGLSAGDYTLFLTDDNNCGPVSQNFTITEPANSLTLNISVDSMPSCSGLSDGGLTATASGGTAPYSYLWDAPIAGNTNSTQTGLSAGSYQLTVTDANNCTAQQNIILNEPTAISININSTDVLCFGDNTGEAIAVVSGGTPGYTYLWEDALNNPVSLDDTASNLGVGDYFLTVSDANGCNQIDNVNISQPDELTATISQVNVSTWGNDDGSATVNPSDGTPTYSYEWEDDSNPGVIISTNQTANNLSAGTYNITVTDANGCIWTGSVTITEPNDPLGGNIITHQNVLCAPDSSGALTAQAYGGTAAYSYYWENSGATWNANTAAITNLPADTYFLTITDANSYEWDTTVTITQPAELIIAGGNHTNNLCFGDSAGTASIVVNGGVPPYNYLWNDPTNSTSDNISNAPAGTYLVLVTDQNGCTADTTITITEPDEIQISITTTANPTCFGDSDGSLSANISGGTGAYNYIWENDASTLISVTDTVIDIPAGDYYLTVTDANGCETQTVYTLTEPSELTASINNTNVTTWGNNDGSASVLAAGGTPTYSYNWEDDANPGVSISNNAAITNLYAGTYNVTVTDANGCEWYGSITITEPNDPLGGNITNHDDVLCAPDSTGQLTASGYGGTPAYSYYWENSSATWSSNSSVITGLPADTYFLTITDANAYEWDTTVIITQPAELIITAGNHTNVLCFGDSTGTASINVSGGIFAYIYQWDDPTLSITDNIANAPAGTYTVIVTDQNACTADTSITITQPNELDLNMIVTAEPLCFGDNNASAGIEISGGTPNYNYSWENSSGSLISLSDTLVNVGSDYYYLTVTDDNGCFINDSIEITDPTVLNATTTNTNVSTWGNNDGSATANPTGGTPTYTYEWVNDSDPGTIISTNQTADNLYAGNYSVTVTDANGCEWYGSVTITEPNDPLGGNIIVHQNVLCAPDSTGMLEAEAFGATPPYSFYWENAVVTLSSDEADFNDLPAGSYFLTITDALGYTWDTAVIISQPPVLEITDTYQTVVTCYGDSTASASIDVSGGTIPYNYVWDGFASTNDTLFNLPEGVYYVSVFDFNGCMADTLIKIETNDSLEMNFLVTAMPLCNGGNEGSLFVTMTGGTNPFSYYWEDEANTNISNTDTVTGLETGNYYLTVTDVNGCMQYDSVFLPEPDPLALSLSGVDATGFGASDAYAWAIESGGTPTYYYQWEDITDPGNILSNQDTLLNVPAGTYSLTLTDDNGCTIEDQITLNQPDELIHTIIGSNVQCNGDTTGGAWLQVSGGVQPYSYSWEDESGTEIWTDSVMIFIPAGTYYVTATDANGYTTNDSITIIQPPALYFGLDSVQNILCNGDNSGYIDLNPNGGTPPYNMEWILTDDPATILDNDDFIENIFAGEYLFTIVDDSTCVYDTIITITQPDSLEVILEAQGDITCYSYNNGFINIDVIGGTPPYQYEWLDDTNTVFETGTDSIGNLGQGAYAVLVSDANFCSSDTMNFFITEPEEFIFNAGIDSVFCFGDSTGSVQLNPAGGTPAFDYVWIFEGDTIIDSNFPALFNLEAGDYEIFVNDANTCLYDTTLTVHEPASYPSLSIDLTDSLDCFGLSNGEITAQINDGTPDYHLIWSNGTGGDGELEDISAGIHIITGIEAGNFIFQLSDGYGCSVIESIFVPEPEEIIIDLFSNNISCNGADDGQIQSVVSGGTSPYFYSWDGNPAGIDTAANNLIPGWHTLEITDANGCTQIDSSYIYQPDSLLVELRDSLFLNCYGDENASTFPIISGGSIPYQAIWTNETGDTIHNTPYITNLGAGMYYLNVTDANGCSFSDSLLVYEPNALSASTESFLTSCPASADGYAVINMDPGAGTPPYSYDWNNPEHSVTDTAINLNAGWWYVTVTDDNNCIYLDSVEVFSPDSLHMSFTITPVQCNNVPGSAVISTIGGTPSYSYEWSTGDSTGIVPNIPAGIHVVTVTDSHSCTWAQQVMIESIGNIHPEIEITEPISCYGARDGELTAILDDGALPFNFDWNTGDTTQSIDELMSGTYFVQVIDAWGCIGNDTLTLTQPEGVTVDFITQDVLCKGGSSGWAQAIANGGNGNFSYAWDADFYGNPYTNLSEGYYTVIATDQEGCSGMETVYIDQPDSAIYALAEARDVTCYGFNNGSGIAQGFGGQAPFQYIWYGPGTDTIYQQQTGATLFPGNYTLLVTDDNGCKYDTIIKIRQPSPIYINVSGSGNPSCSGLEDGWIQLDSITGGTPPYSIHLNGGGISWTQQNPYIDSMPSGQYIINVYDVNRCLQNNDVIILTLVESEENCIRIPAAFSPNGDGFNDVWQIDHLDLYRRCLIQVYNRWGQLLYEGGWNDPFWDGTYNGNPVPTGAYIYYVNLGTNSRKPLTGTVTVIR